MKSILFTNGEVYSTVLLIYTLCRAGVLNHCTIQAINENDKQNRVKD